jgi:hypothetical protein
MASMSGLQERLARASSVPELLDAAYEAFEDVLTVVRQHDDPGGGLFIPMVMAAGSAADGRDSICRAPSLPPRSLHAGQPVERTDRFRTAQAAAAWVAGVCEVLADRLAGAASPAAEAGDRGACLDAACSAREVRALMSGGQA